MPPTANKKAVPVSTERLGEPSRGKRTQTKTLFRLRSLGGLGQAWSNPGIGVAADLENVMCGVRNFSGQLVQSFFGLLGQVGFIKTKVHGGFSNRMIVIQVGHSIGKRIHARDGLSSSLLGLVGQSACRHGLLVGSFGRGVYAGNALLCPAIYITDVAGVTVRDFIELI